ncbi:MAG TPA: class I SAM-dependent RNA methyltransferase [Kineosporiaceae bacterium]|nr:class I SAM-dependent RNA methyltransferase [Kineosporiaceae bacterium]
MRLDVGPVAHGGHCVARYQGRVVFVRHALPEEQVTARLTEAGPADRFWRADAVEVHTASADRVESACPLSGPGACGGCDWQHVGIGAQRALKAAVVIEQLTRLGRIDPGHPVLAGLRVRAVPGDTGGLGWRTRVRFAVDDRGRPGLRRHRAHDVVPVPHCPIAHPGVDEVQAGLKRWPGSAAVEVVVAPDPARPQEVQHLVVVEPREAGPAASGRSRVDVPPLAVEASVARRGPQGLQRLRGRTWVEESVTVDGTRRTFRVTGGGFWQVHPGAAQTLLDTVLELADPRPGETALDLYCGVGLFTAGLALRVGATGTVLGVEGDPRGAADARRSLHDLPMVRLESGGVEPVLRGLTGSGELAGADVVVLDPPRSGAGRKVVEAVTALRPRVVVYVACDPAALARDVATAAGLGYRLDGLAAFDTFPMTHHVECVARLVPDPASGADQVPGTGQGGSADLR